MQRQGGRRSPNLTEGEPLAMDRVGELTTRRLGSGCTELRFFSRVSLQNPLVSSLVSGEPIKFSGL